MPPEYLLPWTCGIDEDAIEGKGKVVRKRKESKLQYSCPRCAINEWGKPGLHLRCDDCSEALVSEGGNASDGDAGAEQAGLWAA